MCTTFFYAVVQTIFEVLPHFFEHFTLNPPALVNNSDVYIIKHILIWIHSAQVTDISFYNATEMHTDSAKQWF